MTRIAVFHNLPAGGARRHTFEQVRELARRGYEIHEYTQSTADLAFMPFDDYVVATHIFELPWDDLRPVAIPGIAPYVHWWQNRANLDRLDRQSREIARQIDAEGFDLVFVKDCRYTIAPYVLRYLSSPSVFYMHSDPFFRSAAEVTSPATLMDRIRARPVHRHEHMVYDEFITNLRHAGRVLTNSQFTRDRIRSRHGVEAHVVYPGVDLATFYPRPHEDSGSFVLSAGSLNPRKGHWFVIEALGLIPAETRPRLVVATPMADEAPRKALLRHALTHEVEADIRTVRDTDELAGIYSAALALLFAPSNEWLGLVALEAMACGKPVVGVGEGGLVETIQDGRTGYLVERDPAQFAAAVARVMGDNGLRHRLGEQARRMIEGYWTWDRAVDDLETQFAAVSRPPAGIVANGS